MERGCLRVGPNASSFRTVDVLYDLVLNITEDVVTSFIFLLADFCADFDEEGIFLRV